MNKEQKSEIKNAESVKYWLETIASKRTKENYLIELPKFIEFISKNPDVIIKERREQMLSKDPQTRRHYEHLVIQFQNKLAERKLAPYTVRSYLRTVMSFFSANECPLKFRRKELKPAYPKKSQKHIASNEEIRAMYSFADVRERALLLTMYQTGLSPVDTCSLNIEDYDFYNAEAPYYFEKYREKTEMLTGTCFSEEALHDIQLMLKERSNPEKGSLFITQKNTQLEPRIVRDILEKLAEKAEIKDFQPKDLRDAYHDALERASINSQVIDRMMGHKLGGARDSYKISKYTVIEAYTKAFQYLTINQHRLEREATLELRRHFLELSKKVEEERIKREKLEKYVTTVVPKHAPELEYYDEVANFIKTSVPNAEINDVFYDVLIGQDSIVVEIRGYLDKKGKFVEVKAKIIKKISSTLKS